MTAKKGLDLGDTVRRSKPATPAPAPQRGANADRVALTLRIDQATYERLALFAAKRRQKHQAILETALLAYLDANE